MIQVLYEDNHIIAVYKPAGTLVQGDKTGDRTLANEVATYLKKTYHKPGNVFVGVVHRLDRPVSGIVLFGKTSKGAARLSEQIRNRSIKKIYHALVIGVPKKKEDTLVHFLKKDSKKNSVRVFDKETPGALRAELSYIVEHADSQHAIVRIALKTGRSHQIRTQFAAIGHPVVGDVKYGAPDPLSDQSLALCATSVTFQRATGAEEKTINISIPDVWQDIHR